MYSEQSSESLYTDIFGIESCSFWFHGSVIHSDEYFHPKDSEIQWPQTSGLARMVGEYVLGSSYKPIRPPRSGCQQPEQFQALALSMAPTRHCGVWQAGGICGAEAPLPRCPRSCSKHGGAVRGAEN